MLCSCAIHACANSFILINKTEADQTKPEPLYQNSRVRQSNHTYITLKLNLDLLCPLSELANGTPHIPVRDMCAWVDCPLAHDNYQVISILTGRSWKIESFHICKQYKTLAVIEKQKHAGAYPEYQFSLSSKKKQSRTGRPSSQKLILYLEIFSKVS
ncbi:uncharacterized protein BO88DRAFT_430008 [Aspergillus vadensis CBS 113365]|uniref:Uncharacterized protein n=1 Tax=Aspergillus vadensis (strain CBS 113365 / IMI 142717 / IBT 24658) TaxID=1448311 RepID=A0A319AWN7_ASPVC|nr:hypothetical protein BO88DRAFT_430008 [Aspergillus vadensis CBS 113365]PYH64024.1 hypothetical protein BO88DRAFT_430008 [Aspergillus vadensis CBS 113365]